jgi:hypothetical protein|uniref:Uncharacterized protein n=1 Tax=viral metagenome TaxID=1070528 RepID=A0A6C0BJ26_9ZZZZ
MEFKSHSNKQLLLGIINEVAQKKFQISLDPHFDEVLDQMMDFVSDRFGQKPPNVTQTEHQKNLSKCCIDQAIQYIANHREHFSQLDLLPNPPNSHPTNFNSGTVVSPSVPVSTSPVSTSQYPSENNLFKGTDDLYKQMHYDSQPSAMPMNMQMPVQNASANETETRLQSLLDQRRKDAGYMATPPANNMGMCGPMGTPIQSYASNIQTELCNLIMSTQTAFKNPTMVAPMVQKIMNMPQMMDLQGSNPIAFKQQVTNPQFLEMVLTLVNNENNPKMRPMSLEESAVPVPIMGPSGGTTETGSINAEFQKLVSKYRNEDGGGVGGGLALDLSLLNQMIPPSEQLIAHMMPDLDQIHLIDYDLTLDFRTDLEINQTEKNRYALKFIKFGNLSKVELTSCLIPESDALAREPYLYLKIDELGGRCYMANHDCTFGKMILTENKNGYLYYQPDRGSCLQTFSQPVALQRLTISFLNYDGKTINLKEIVVDKYVKLKKQNKLKIMTKFKHKLQKGNTLDLQVYFPENIEQYEIQVDEVVDEQTFIVDDTFEKLSDKIVLLRHEVNCSFRFKLSEINWNLLTKKNLQNAQMIRLSQLVSERRKEVMATNGDEQEIIKYAQSKIQPQQPGSFRPV